MSSNGKPTDTAGRTAAGFFGRLSPRTWTMILLPLGIAFVIFFLSLISFLNIVKLEDRAQGYAIHYMKDFTRAAKLDERIRIVLIPTTDPGGDSGAPSGNIDKKHRKFFGDLVRALAKARAKIVAFDISFDKYSEFDKDFGDAISEAEGNNVKVILGVDSYTSEKGTDPKIPADFRHNDRWGTIVAGGVLGDESTIGTIKVADSESGVENPPVIPSLALRTVVDSFEPPLEASFDEARRNVLLYSGGASRTLFRSIPLERGSGLWIDQASAEELQNVRVTAQKFVDEMKNAAALADYKDTIVLVGYELDDMRTTASGEKRLGLELHATAISNIFNQVFIYRLTPVQNFLGILLMSFLGALLHTRFGNWAEFRVPVPIPLTGIQLPIPLGIIIISALYLIVAFVVYRLSRIYLDVCYHIAALLISYGAVWFALNKWFQKQPTVFTVKS